MLYCVVKREGKNGEAVGEVSFTMMVQLDPHHAFCFFFLTFNFSLLCLSGPLTVSQSQHDTFIHLYDEGALLVKKFKLGSRENP